MDAEPGRFDNENFDALLDAALRTRIDAEPRLGLEDRVLARLQAEPARKSFSWTPIWATAFALVVFALMIAYSQQKPHSAALPTLTVNPARTQSAPVQGAGNVVQKRSRNLAHNRTLVARSGSNGSMTLHDVVASVHQETLPKLASFPGPLLETSEERMLARLARQRSSLDLAEPSIDELPLKVRSVPEFKIEAMEEAPADDTPQD